MNMDDKVILTAKQALSMLPAGGRIHTFRSNSIGLMGADWERDELERAIKVNQCEIGGNRCQAMNHGLVIWTGEATPLFVECREGLDYDSFEQKAAP